MTDMYSNVVHMATVTRPNHGSSDHFKKLICVVRAALPAMFFCFLLVGWRIGTCIEKHRRRVAELAHAIQQRITFSRSLLPSHIGNHGRKSLCIDLMQGVNRVQRQLEFDTKSLKCISLKDVVFGSIINPQNPSPSTVVIGNRWKARPL